MLAKATEHFSRLPGRTLVDRSIGVSACLRCANANRRFVLTSGIAAQTNDRLHSCAWTETLHKHSSLACVVPRPKPLVH